MNAPLSTKTPDEGLFRYVRHDDVYSYMQEGWMIAALFPVEQHAQHGVLMWHCDCSGYRRVDT